MLTFVTYTGNGATTVYTVPFAYINKYHIVVLVAGVSKTQGTDFTISGSTLTFVAAPANGAVVLIRRETPRTGPLVTFVDGSYQNSVNLNKASLQNLYVAQEVYENSLQHDDTGYDVGGLRVMNVGAPVASNDAATKAYVDAGDASVTSAASAANTALQATLQASIDTKAATSTVGLLAAAIAAHTVDTTNPHVVTKSQVGLSNVPNYAEASQAEAEAGGASDKLMTPARVTQWKTIVAQIPQWFASRLMLTPISDSTPSVQNQPLVYSGASWAPGTVLKVNSLQLVDTVTGQTITVTIQDGAIALS